MAHPNVPKHTTTSLKQGYGQGFPQASNQMANGWGSPPAAQKGQSPQNPRSVKYLTCFYWKEGSCKKSADECLYSHYDTGIYAERPRPVIPGGPSLAGKNLDKAKVGMDLWRRRYSLRQSESQSQYAASHGAAHSVAHSTNADPLFRDNSRSSNIDVTPPRMKLASFPRPSILNAAAFHEDKASRDVNDRDTFFHRSIKDQSPPQVFNFGHKAVKGGAQEPISKSYLFESPETSPRGSYDVHGTIQSLFPNGSSPPYNNNNTTTPPRRLTVGAGRPSSSSEDSGSDGIATAHSKDIESIAKAAAKLDETVDVLMNGMTKAIMMLLRHQHKGGADAPNLAHMVRELQISHDAGLEKRNQACDLAKDSPSFGKAFSKREHNP